jgi:prepilin-type N-terminal cleavage/methylation domain-containing protein
MSGSPGTEEGFSLLEVLIAVVVLASTAAGLGGMFAIAAVSTRMARSETLAVLLATDKVEQLRGLAWSFDASGTATSDTTSDVSVQPVTSFGQGLRASPVDSLQRNTTGYVDYLDQTGRWVGTGPQPVAGAVYVRRWNIQRLPSDPENTLVFQVLVTPVAGSSTAAPSVVAVRHPADALLTSLRTRKGV